MSLKNWSELEPGTVNPDAGNAVKHLTGVFRRGRRPQFNPSVCVHCFICWNFCPDNAILTDDDRVTGVDYDYCKGCGICAFECPVKTEPKPLVMVPEEKDQEEDATA